MKCAICGEESEYKYCGKCEYNNRFSPCKECADRKAGCHSKCKEYALFIDVRKACNKRIKDEERVNIVRHCSMENIRAEKERKSNRYLRRIK